MVVHDLAGHGAAVQEVRHDEVVVELHDVEVAEVHGVAEKVHDAAEKEVHGVVVLDAHRDVHGEILPQIAREHPRSKTNSQMTTNQLPYLSCNDA